MSYVGDIASGVALLRDLLAALAALGCLYLIVACAVVLRFRLERRTHSQPAGAVSVLVPLCGSEPELQRRIRALCTQAYAGPVQIIWGVQDPQDPAVPLVEGTMREFPGRDLTLSIDPTARGGNRKVANLVNMMKHARHPTIVAIDSDIEVGPDYLSVILETLQGPQVGAVTCLYHGRSSRGLCAALSALGIDLHFLPNVCVALKFGLARPCFGSTVAMRRATLERIGGFEAFADELFDDYAIGEAVRFGGEEVAIPPLLVGHVCSESTARELAHSQLRYARTVRAIDPIGSAGAIITHPFPIALLAAAFGSEHGLDLGLFALACRLALCLCIEHRFGLGHHRYWLLPLRDLVSFLAYAGSFLTDTVVWRGRRYQVAADDPRRLTDGKRLTGASSGH